MSEQILVQMNHKVHFYVDNWTMYLHGLYQKMYISAYSSLNKAD